MRIPAFYVALLIGFGLLAQTPPPPIDNDQARVVRALDQPHKKGPLHEHKLNRVMIYLDAGRQIITPQGGKPVTIIEVEVKKDGDPGKTANNALDSLKVDPKDYKLVFENSQVRVIRVKIAAGKKIPMHEHVLNRVVVYLTDQNGSMTTPDGQTTTAQHKAGEFSWGTPVKHMEQNNLDHAFEAIVVEFKS